MIRYFSDYPDYVAKACGSGGFFIYEKKVGKAEKEVKFFAVKPTAVPTATRGLYDFGGSVGLMRLPRYRLWEAASSHLLHTLYDLARKKIFLTCQPPGRRCILPL